MLLDPGYTFDAIKNKMIVEAWPLASRSRRMRLDRIILKSKVDQHNKEAPRWVPETMQLFGHRRVASPVREDEDAKSQERELLLFEREWKRRKVLWWLAGWVTYVPRLLKTLAASTFDLFGINAFRTVDDYLWPSDHFGLVAVLVPSTEQEGKVDEDEREKERRKNKKKKSEAQ